MAKVTHTTIRNGKLFCLHCGDEHALPMPMSVDDFSNKTKAFNAIHGNCKKTWTEPVVDKSLSFYQKAMWWMDNGETGSSSKTMWNCFMQRPTFPVNHPYDPDDFSRCYKLLETVPEWKTQLDRLRHLSPVWSNLVDNWDKLTSMYEENVKTHWKNSKKIGMYDFMQKLIA